MLGVELMGVFADKGLETSHSVVSVDDVSELLLKSRDEARNGG